jgi:hypothetical protein
MQHVLPERLFTPAIDAVTLGIDFDYPNGWRVAVVHRHSGEGWSLCAPDRYDSLTAHEACTVVQSVLEDLLAPGEL